MLEPTRIDKDEVKRRMDAGEEIVFLDSRTPDAWDSAARQIPGSIRLRPSEVENHLRLVPQGHPIVTYCSCPNEKSSARAAWALIENGWKDVHPLQGGFREWEQAGYPVEPRRERATG